MLKSIVSSKELAWRNNAKGVQAMIVIYGIRGDKSNVRVIGVIAHKAGNTDEQDEAEIKLVVAEWERIHNRTLDRWHWDILPVLNTGGGMGKRIYIRRQDQQLDSQLLYTDWSMESC